MNDKSLPIAVVGAGAGGLPAAVALSEKGHKVILIEGGDKLDQKDIITNRYDYELDNSPWLKSSSEWSGPFRQQQGNGLGGSTLYYQAVSQMPPVNTIKQWGLSPVRINKIRDEVVNFLQIAGEVQPHHKLNPVSNHLYQSAKNLGWKVRHAPVAILSRAHDDRPACNYCGLCVYGCRPGDKSSVDKTWLPRINNSDNVKILTNTKVDSIELKDERTAKSIKITTAGSATTIDVRAVVLSAGVFETPYLLKNSTQQFAQNGIGNKNVGRYLTGTLWQSLLLSVPGNVSNGFSGIPIDLIVEQFVEQGIQLSQGRNHAGITGPISTARMLLSNNFDGDVRAWIRNHYHRLAGIGGFAESSTRFNDGIGLDKIKSFTKEIDASDREKIESIRTILLQWALAANANIVLYLGDVSHPIVGSMLRGTCAIGINPKYSAVNIEGQLWGYDNIYISDASILGRGLIANPSLVLQVLGLYIGRNLAERLSKL